MYSDDNGRDITDRLIWQQELHKRLEGIVPLPKIIDFFTEEDSYLVMEYIKGESLYETIRKINNSSNSWFDLSPQKATLILDTILQVISTIERLHAKGIVHRDIVSVNFMIDKKNRLYLIDLELAYSLSEKKPLPPFDLGTPGYMSLEQQSKLQPTEKEDIYGLGALMLDAFTGISPNKFNTYDRKNLQEGLSGLLQNNDLSNLIAACLEILPEDRPSLPTISRAITQYRKTLTSGNSNKNLNYKTERAQHDQMRELISFAINGLIKPPTVLLDDLWYSKMKSISNHSSSMHKEYTRHVGFFEGIGGVLYLLGRVKSIGININSCINSYQKGCDYIYSQLNSLSPETNPGLYNGFAGVAIALTEGLNNSLLIKNDTNLKYLREMLLSPIKDLTVSNGIAGQGIAIMACSKYLPDEMVNAKLDLCLEQILKRQQKDGFWEIPSATKHGKQLSFGYGNTGIIWFLLQYISRHPENKLAKQHVNTALTWLLKNMQRFSGFTVVEKQKGILLTLIKAYETLQLVNYRSIVENALYQYPAYVASNDFSQRSGLAGIGEIYLEAARVFENEEWKSRANWIANLLSYTFKKSSDNSGYWQIEETNLPTADFMVGNSGIIHFLARNTEPSKLGYRLLQ